VLVTSGRRVVSYLVARCLGERGVDVVCCDSSRLAMSFFSRYCSARFVCPDPVLDDGAFVREVRRQSSRLGVDLIVPTYEDTFVVARHREELAGPAVVAAPPYDELMRLHDKENLPSLGAVAGVRVPRTVVCRSAGDAAAAAGELGLPMVLKPSRKAAGEGFVLVKERRGLEERFERCRREQGVESLLAQEYVPGETYGVGMLLNRGRLRAKFAHRFVRVMYEGAGSPSVRIGVRKPAMERALERLLSTIGWHGVCEADFIEHEETGIPYLVDLNPRFWASIYAAAACGVNFPYLLCRMLLDGDVEPVLEHEVGAGSVWGWGELRGIVDRLATPGDRLCGVARLVRWRGMRAVDDFSWRDPLPFFAEPVLPLLRALSGGRLDPTWEVHPDDA